MVERVFHKIADRLHQPGPIEEEGEGIVSGKGERFPLPSGPESKMLFDAAHHVGDIFIRFFKDNGSRVQPGDFQKILHEASDAVKLLLGEVRKFPDFRRARRFLLKDSVIDVQSGEGRFQLVGDVGNGVFQKAFRLRLMLRVGVQDGYQGIDLMKQAVQSTLLIAGDPGALIPGKIILNLRDGVLHDPVLFPEMEIQQDENGKPGPCEKERRIQRRVRRTQERTDGRDQDEQQEGEQDTDEKAFDFPVGQDFHGNLHSRRGGHRYFRDHLMKNGDNIYS